MSVTSRLLGMDLLWAPNDLARAIALAGVAFTGLGWILLGLVVAFRDRAARPRTEVPQPA